MAPDAGGLLAVGLANPLTATAGRQWDDRRWVAAHQPQRGFVFKDGFEHVLGLVAGGVVAALAGCCRPERKPTAAGDFKIMT